MTQVDTTMGPVSDKTPPDPIRIARLTDAYYISVAPSVMTNDSKATMKFSLFMGKLEEDETVILSFDPDNVRGSSWPSYLTFMGAIQNTKAKVVVRCDKVDFSDFAYFYLLGTTLDITEFGALFFSPLYTNSKDALSKYELTGVDYLLGLVKTAVERGLITEDQFHQIDQGGYTAVNYDGLKARMATEKLSNTVIMLS